MTPPCRRVCRRKYSLQAPYISLVAQQRVSHRFPFIVPCKKPPFIIRASQILSAGVVIDDGGFYVSAGRIEARSSLTEGLAVKPRFLGFLILLLFLVRISTAQSSAVSPVPPNQGTSDSH